MATLRINELKKDAVLEDFIMELFTLRFLLSKEEEQELEKRFKEYHGDNPDYEKMPMWKFVYENVEVKLKKQKKLLKNMLLIVPVMIMSRIQGCMDCEQLRK